MKVLIDTLNVVMIVFSTTKRLLHDRGEEFNKDNVGFFYHMYFNKLNDIFQTYGKDSVIFCWEGLNSTKLRKSIFPGYKANRKKVQRDSEFETLITLFKPLKEAMWKYPCKQLATEDCEGDDIIFSLAEKYQEEEVTVISTDGDLKQLISFFPKTEVYNPIKRTFVEENKNILLEKAIVGDSSDGIPGLNRIGKKTFEKMLNDKEEWDKVLGKQGNKKIFETFLEIIDLRKYPKELSNKIKEEDEELEFSEFNPDALEKFFLENKMQDMLKKWINIKNEIYSACMKDDDYRIKIDSEDEEINKALEEFF